MNLNLKTYIFLNTFVISGLILYFNSPDDSKLLTAWLVVIVLMIIIIDNFITNLNVIKNEKEKKEKLK